MKIVRKDIDDINIKIELTLEPTDYSDKFKSEINKIKNTAQIKGFRKGKTPDSVIKKMYGKSILLDVINNQIHDNLNNYIKEEELKFIGQPLPNHEENLNFDLDINNLKEYTFSFDMGLVPHFEISGISNEDTYDFYDVVVTDEMIKEEVESARKRMGKQQEIDDNIEPNDIIKLEAEELDGGIVKEGGWKTTFTILVDLVKNEEVKNEILKSKKGDTLNFDIFSLEDRGEEHTKKYLLNLPEDNQQNIGRDFAGTIISISRVVPAEMDDDFFASFGQDKIVDENSLVEAMKGDLKKFFDNQALQLMYVNIRDGIIENHKFELPNIFLKKYLKATNEGVSDEILEQEFDSFANNMRWTLIKSNLAAKFDISIEESDIKNHFFQKIFEYTRSQGMMDYSFISSMADNMMKNEKQVNQAYEEILANRMFHEIGQIVKRNPIEISAKDFEAKVKDFNKSTENEL